jgi:hypothetical protein
MATGASNDHVRLDARGVAFFKFGSDVTAPYVIANTAEVLVKYKIWPP